MIDEDLKLRVRRLLAEEFRGEDLDRLYLGLRSRAHVGEAVQEVGDFVAHRDQREKGPATQVVRDIVTSAQIWLIGRTGGKPTIEDVRVAAKVNLRLASDQQILDGTGLTRSAASSSLGKVFRKLERDSPLKQREAKVLEYFGNRFIWNAAFTDDALFDDFAQALVTNSLMSAADLPKLLPAKSFLTLHAIALMHGSSILLENGDKASLHAGFVNGHTQLAVKAQIPHLGFKKPIYVDVCLFWSTLSPMEYCEPNLLGDPTAWGRPIELSAVGRLVGTA